MIKIAPSILSADFSRLGEQVALLEKAEADLVHIDVMDGNFVPNISFGSPIIKAIRKATTLPFDVHLMIDRPSRYIEDFVKAGSDYITVHYESEIHMDRLINYIKSFNIKAGIAINPSTPTSLLQHLLPQVDLVLIMSVNPGFGGQSLIPYTLEKISALKEIREKSGYNFMISIDGGITEDTCCAAAAAGADILVSGSTVFKNNEIEKNLCVLRDILNK